MFLRLLSLQIAPKMDMTAKSRLKNYMPLECPPVASMSPKSAKNAYIYDLWHKMFRK